MLEFGYPWLALLIVLPLILSFRRQSDTDTRLKLPALAKLASSARQASSRRLGLRSLLAA